MWRGLARQVALCSLPRWLTQLCDFSHSSCAVWTPFSDAIQCPSGCGSFSVPPSLEPQPEGTAIEPSASPLSRPPPPRRRGGRTRSDSDSPDSPDASPCLAGLEEGEPWDAAKPSGFAASQGSPSSESCRDGIGHRPNSTPNSEPGRREPNPAPLKCGAGKMGRPKQCAVNVAARSPQNINTASHRTPPWPAPRRGPGRGPHRRGRIQRSYSPRAPRLGARTARRHPRAPRPTHSPPALQPTPL